MHQDAHEFLIYLLNKIAEDLEEEARNVRSGSSSGEDCKFIFDSIYTAPSHRLNSCSLVSSSVISNGTPTLATVTTRSNSSTRLNFVHELFEGVLTSETRCLTCETVCFPVYPTFLKNIR